jgi:hypothetical protein
MDNEIYTVLENKSLHLTHLVDSYRNEVGVYVNSAARLLSALVGAGGFEPPTYTVSIYP